MGFLEAADEEVGLDGFCHPVLVVCERHPDAHKKLGGKRHANKRQSGHAAGNVEEDQGGISQVAASTWPA